MANGIHFIKQITPCPVDITNWIKLSYVTTSISTPRDVKKDT